MLVSISGEIERFLNTRQSPNTRICYAHILNRLCDFLIHHSLSFQDLNEETFTEFLDIQPWNATSRYLALQVTKAFLRWKFGDNALLKMKSKRPKPHPQLTMTQEQFNILMGHFNTMSPKGCRDLAMVMVLAETGLRASEVCNLEMKDLFLDQRYLVVLGKGSRWKLCRLSKETVNILNLWLGYRRDLGTNAKTVFVSVRGKKRNMPMDRFGLLTTFRRISSEVGFYFTPHVFRRLMATRMLELGATEEAVKQQGDWRSDRDFRRYIQTYRLREIEPYSPVSSFFRGDDEQGKKKRE